MVQSCQSSQVKQLSGAAASDFAALLRGELRRSVMYTLDDSWLDVAGVLFFLAPKRWYPRLYFGLHMYIFTQLQ